MPENIFLLPRTKNQNQNQNYTQNLARNRRFKPILTKQTNYNKEKRKEKKEKDEQIKPSSFIKKKKYLLVRERGGEKGDLYDLD